MQLGKVIINIRLVNKQQLSPNLISLILNKTLI